MRLIWVCATRDSRTEFEKKSPLAQSLRQIGQSTNVHLNLFAENKEPLGKCYNQAIEDAHAQDVLVFVHDDAYINDWLAGWRIQEALLHFDVVGVAGNRRRQAGQETWYLQPGRLRGDKIHQASWDKNFLSGSIMHGTLPDAKLSEYGPTPSPVKLLDGVLLACKAERLQSNGVRFDPALGFHLYDLDFCRAAEDAGLTLGTWPIAITHASSGESIESENWIKSCQKYLSKYNEANTSP